eukprot:3968978-Pyramimonas_sp.AAC.1
MDLEVSTPVTRGVGGAGRELSFSRRTPSPISRGVLFGRPLRLSWAPDRRSRERSCSLFVWPWS